MQTTNKRQRTGGKAPRSELAAAPPAVDLTESDSNPFNATWVRADTGKPFDGPWQAIVEEAFLKGEDTVKLFDSAFQLQGEIDLNKMVLSNTANQTYGVMRKCEDADWNTTRIDLPLPVRPKTMSLVKRIGSALGVRASDHVGYVAVTGESDALATAVPLIADLLMDRQPPQSWSFQPLSVDTIMSRYSRQVAVFRIPFSSPEYHHVFQKLPRTFRNVVIDRIQNSVLWERYCSAKAVLQLRGSPTTELELFHGTRRCNPIELAHGDFGFDPRCTGPANAWGRGCYFSESPEYAGAFAHVVTLPPDGQPDNGSQGFSGAVSAVDPYTGRPLATKAPEKARQIILASVLVGDMYCGAPLPTSTPAFRDLTRPPEKSLEAPLDGTVVMPNPPKRENCVPTSEFAFYDSVCGTSPVGQSRNYTIYELGLAYPRYIITYQDDHPLVRGGPPAKPAAPVYPLPNPPVPLPPAHPALPLGYTQAQPAPPLPPPNIFSAPPSSSQPLPSNSAFSFSSSSSSSSQRPHLPLHVAMASVNGQSYTVAKPPQLPQQQMLPPQQHQQQQQQQMLPPQQHQQQQQQNPNPSGR